MRYSSTRVKITTAIITIMNINEEKLAQSYAKLIQQRRHFPPNSDIWHLRFHWGTIKAELISKLENKQYSLSPMQIITKTNGEQRAIWSAMDALVIHYLTQELTVLLPTHPLCEHIKGHGGGNSSVTRLHQHLVTQHTHFVFRTDIKGYYANINKTLLLSQIGPYVHDAYLLELVRQFLYYSVEDGGLFHTPIKGIARSSSLSPLLAAFHLYCIDEYFSNQPQTRYTRYMDDFIILTKTRWQLRKAVATLNRFFSQFGFKQHPDKTFIGRITKGFDWLGRWFTHRGCTGVSPRALQNHLTKRRRLYERIQHLPAQEQVSRMTRYVARWQQWQTSMTSAVGPAITAIAPPSTDHRSRTPGW